MPVVSTVHRLPMKPVQSHTQNKLKPTAVVDYIGNVAGVDHSDQMVSYMPMHRKTIEWRKKTGLPLPDPHHDTGQVPVPATEESATQEIGDAEKLCNLSVL